MLISGHPQIAECSCFNIGRSSNGRTEAFEAFNLGSIPSLPAKPKNHESGLF